MMTIQYFKILLFYFEIAYCRMTVPTIIWVKKIYSKVDNTKRIDAVILCETNEMKGYTMNEVGLSVLSSTSQRAAEHSLVEALIRVLSALPSARNCFRSSSPSNRFPLNPPLLPHARLFPSYHTPASLLFFLPNVFLQLHRSKIIISYFVISVHILRAT